MNLLDSIARRLGGGRYTPPEKPLDDREAVFANPERYTRRSRRAVGYLQPVWAKLMRPAGPVFSRYMRRHYKDGMFDPSLHRTRRERRHRARIIRSIERQGRQVA